MESDTINRAVNAQQYVIQKRACLLCNGYPERLGNHMPSKNFITDLQRQLSKDFRSTISNDMAKLNVLFQMSRQVKCQHHTGDVWHEE